MKLRLLLQLFFISVLSLSGSIVVAQEKNKEAKVTYVTKKKNNRYRVKNSIATVVSVIFVGIIGIFLYTKKKQQNRYSFLPASIRLQNTQIFASLEGGKQLVLDNEKEEKCYLYDTIKSTFTYIDSGSFRDIVISHNKKWLLIPKPDNSLNLYDIEKRKLIKGIASDINLTWNLDFSPADKYVILPRCEKNERPQFFLYLIDDLLNQKEDPKLVSDIYPALSPKDKYVAIIKRLGQLNQYYILYDSKDFKNSIFEAKGTDSSFSKKGTYFMIKNEKENYVILWDMKEKKYWSPQKSLKASNGQLKGSSIYLGYDEKYVVIRSEDDNHIYFDVYNTLTKKHFQQITIRNAKNMSAWCKVMQNNHLAVITNFYSSHQFRKVTLYYLPTKKKIASYQGSLIEELTTEKSNYMALYLGGKKLEDKSSIMIYDLEGNKEIVNKDFNAAKSIEYSSDNFVCTSNLNNAKHRKLTCWQFSNMNQPILKKDKIASFLFDKEENGDEVLLVINSQGTLDKHNLTQLAKNR